MENHENEPENDVNVDSFKEKKGCFDFEDSVYYGVHIPITIECQPFEDVEKTNVFTDKMDALKVVKKYKKARFKVFNYYHEAVEFATHGSQLNLNCIPTNFKKEMEGEAPITIEKCQFRGPKSQDLVKLRKAIETNDLDFVERTVWENPRYLISSGDTPSILQEGFRYNGLHIAAKAKNSDMCELILNTVGNTKFIEKLYGDDQHQDSEDRSKILLDLYLNTPDKGLNETPLHFAVKFGALKVAQVLVSFPQCDKNVRNKYGKLPSQIVCDRCDGYAETLKQQIVSVLEDNYYVPVLRAEDNCTPPVIGVPFSISNPPNYGNDPLQPRLEIHAYAGPMDKKGADKFRKIWKTPPRSITKSAFDRSRERLNNTFDSASSYNLKLRDPEKGLEAVGRELADKYNVSWKEYWPFLDQFIDVSSEEGLQQLEAYLKNRNEKPFANLTSPEKTTYVDEEKQSFNSIDSLCRRFDAFNLEDDDSLVIMTQDDDIDVCPFVCVERSLKIFANRICNILRNLIKNGNVDFNSISLLEAEMKLIEQLIASYIDDKRFLKVNFQCAHHRLANLTISLLCKESSSKESETKLREICLKCLKNLVEEFSMNNQLVCVLKNILLLINGRSEENLNLNDGDEDCQTTWENANECSCVFNDKCNKQRYSVRRKNGNNNHLRRKNSGVEQTNIFNCISKNLFKDDCEDKKLESDSSEDEEFYTPPSSPVSLENCLDNDDKMDCFEDCHLAEDEIFIEGSEPTKTDQDVYNALQRASDKLNPHEYPNVYKWRHTVSLYTEEERKSWSSIKQNRLEDISIKLTSTPSRGNTIRENSFCSPVAYSSPKSWFRITGLNSPRASLNKSFNL